MRLLSWHERAVEAIEAMRGFDLVMRDEEGVIHEVRGAPNDIWHAMIDATLGGG